MKTKIERHIRKIIADAKKTANQIKKLRKLGASDHEIAKALQLSEEDIRLL
jgi:DNA-directed RNA polymerase specialized sigma subunit